MRRPELRGEVEQLRFLRIGPVVLLRLRDPEHAAELAAHEHRHGDASFHAGLLRIRSRAARRVGLQIANGHRLPLLRRETGDAFANRHHVDDLHEVRRDPHLRREPEHAFAHEVHRAGLAAEVRERGTQHSGGWIGGGQRGGEIGDHRSAALETRKARRRNKESRARIRTCATPRSAFRIPPFMNRLTPILEQKQREVAKLLPRAEHLRNAALLRNDFRGFAAALDLGRSEVDFSPEALALIAEVKKASPSAGVIAADFAPVRIAEEYEAAGAHAISVLTDEQFFQGHLSYLTKVRNAVGLPCLRKDFIIHEVQIFEAAVAGADAILLIVAALDDKQLRHLFEVATACQLDVLVEVHDLPELDRALALDAQLIGINNRNLTTFQVDLETTVRLSEQVPDDVILVAESGLKTREDTQRVFDAGCNAILVGESLMRTGNIAAQVAELLSVEPGANWEE